MPKWAERLPAFDPDAGPVKLRCPGRKVYGWVYPDGTLELICRERNCKRPGYETRHLMSDTGLCVDLHVPLQEPEQTGGEQ